MKIVKWERSEDGFTNSKCGSYKIKPLYSGCVKAQWYEATYYAEKIARHCATQGFAKHMCQRHADEKEDREKQEEQA